MKKNDFKILLGKKIINWVGCELALIPGEGGKLSIWDSEITPYRQYFEIEIICADGSRFNIESKYDEDGDVELALKPDRKDLEFYVATDDDFVRVQNLDMFPKGEINSIDVILDEYENIVRLNLVVGSAAIALESGFVAQEKDTLVIQRPEEFVIINTAQTV